MSAMKRPATSSRVLLVEDRRAGADAPAALPVRRYRLARLRFDGPSDEPATRFDYLKRSHD